MREYRIVCDRKVIKADGAMNVYEHVPVQTVCGALPKARVFTDKADAMKALSETVRRARAVDMQTQRELAHGDREQAYEQMNIRIQSRSVTEWKE